MKRNILLLLVLLIGLGISGCTRILKMEPTSGPPGTPVWVKCCGTFGDPAELSLKWDGNSISNPFPGSFIVPAVSQGGEPGKHTVLLVDKLDASEAFLIFPIFRVRHATATFTVTKP